MISGLEIGSNILAGVVVKSKWVLIENRFLHFILTYTRNILIKNLNLLINYI